MGHYLAGVHIIFRNKTPETKESGLEPLSQLNKQTPRWTPPVEALTPASREHPKKKQCLTTTGGGKSSPTLVWPHKLPNLISDVLQLLHKVSW